MKTGGSQKHAPGLFSSLHQVRPRLLGRPYSSVQAIEHSKVAERVDFCADTEVLSARFFQDANERV
jgi:hypothetical protein